MMENRPKSEASFLRFLEEQLIDRLPRDWAFRFEEQAGRYRQPDATFSLRSPDGRFAIVAIEFNSSIEPRMLPEIRHRAEKSDSDAFLVGAPFLSPRTRALLAQANLSYADLTGNLRLSTTRPAVFVETQGKTKNPWREARPLKSLKGRAVARVVRALCDCRPPYRTGELAKRSGASLATTSRVIALLDKEALITRERSGIVASVKWDELISRWSEDYSVMKANTATSLLEPRGLDSLHKKLSKTTAEYAVTGSLASPTVVSIAPARLAMVYAQDAGAMSALLGLRATDAGANVILLEPFDPVVFQRTTKRDGIVCATLSQVAADMLNSPGRGPTEGEELIRWMKANEDEWRT